MYPSVTAAKKNAKSFLKGKTVPAVFVTMTAAAAICLLAFSGELISLLPGVSAMPYTARILFFAAYFFAAVCLVAGPLVLGVCRWFWYLTGGSELGTGDVFYYFGAGQYKRTVGFVCSFVLRLALYAALFFMPYWLVALLTSPAFYRLFGSTVPIAMASLAPLKVLLLIIGALFTVFCALRIYLCLPLYCNDDGIPANEVFLLARHFSYYSLTGYTVFLLSFFGWFLLCFLGVPIIWAAPYFFCANAVYCRYSLYYGMSINRFGRA